MNSKHEKPIGFISVFRFISLSLCRSYAGVFEVVISEL